MWTNLSGAVFPHICASRTFCIPTCRGSQAYRAPFFIPSPVEDKKGRILDENYYPTSTAHISAGIVPVYYIRRKKKMSPPQFFKRSPQLRVFFHRFQRVIHRRSRQEGATGAIQRLDSFLELDYYLTSR